MRKWFICCVLQCVAVRVAVLIVLCVPVSPVAASHDIPIKPASQKGPVSLVAISE